MASSYPAVVLLLLLRFSCGAVAVSSSYISRTTEQQIIASAAPAAFADADADDQSDLEGLPFLASPSGSFAAYLRRATTVDNVRDVCYVEVVQQQGGGGGTSSVWESECTPVSGADTCDLAFSPVGLELFAGGHSLWDTAVDSDPEMLSLDGAGDMRIVSRDGVTVWRTRDEPWTGQRCGAPLPVSSSASTVDVLPPPKATTGAKLLTPPAVTSALASPWGSDFSFGDQTAPPFDTEPDQMLPPPPPAADDEGSTDLPDLPLPPPPPPADPSTYWPDLPLPPPPADTYPIPIPETPEVPLYSSPPPAPPTAFVPPQTPLPALDTPPFVPPPGAGIATPPASSGGDSGMAFMPPPAGTPHPHHLPLGASPPLVPGAVAPISGGHGRLPFGQGQGVFGQQQNQLLNGGGQPLEDSAGGWSGRERGEAAVNLAFVGVVALFFGL
ncbi:uncharacterized protein [Lolium perenne]|uniref:uncharacterized protein n=1 Tax=Lolium perenne TaxID=4522 RepID=UPI0021E9F706|nr:uncharacterized protein LOC127302639 [Lolium perenne]